MNTTTFRRLFAVAGVATALAVPTAGAVLAVNVQCQIETRGCWGSPFDDEINGTRRADKMYGLEGNDVLVGQNGDDAIQGDTPGELGNEGNDRLFGGHGKDVLEVLGGSDFLFGGPGDDVIRAKDNVRAGGAGGMDTIYGEAGDDRIDVADGQMDLVDCGDGKDTVSYDRVIDAVKNCENHHPR